MECCFIEHFFVKTITYTNTKLMFVTRWEVIFNESPIAQRNGHVFFNTWCVYESKVYAHFMLSFVPNSHCLVFLHKYLNAFKYTVNK